ncbi:beta-ketoacyl-ACP synthase [Laspinema olomoucense]|uniref:beta-ketoacyl-ACP synthase n=1 Tax=Laspinema olomoucense TaxID=3231600 RepID=UPI0021BA452B|nr:beta-ketoacyl-ACP synthase [Laspinema sp. D3a]MCT7991870.1 beta-ketoacyl-ACP synthase [Laspinema sp. D3a]
MKTGHQGVQVVVTGMGLVCALGDGLEPVWRRLLGSESAIALGQPFPELPPRPLAQIGPTPARLDQLLEPVVTNALQDAGLVPPLPDCGVVIGSSRAHQGQLEQLARQFCQNPPGGDGNWGRNWLDLLPHTPAIATAQQIGSTGPVMAPMAACATGIWAIAQGFELIRTGQCQQVVVGAAEAPITPLALTGFTQMSAYAKTGCYPFDRDREGLVLGEAAAVFVLESADFAHQRGAKKVYGKILGFGITNDARYANAPDEDATVAIAAVEQCLRRSQLHPSEIDYIHAHGTSTHLNDCTEAKLIASLFPQGVPVSSTKGATGHTLGASGALGAAFCLLAMRDRCLPPCVGLALPEFELDFVRRSRQIPVERTLCFSFGFGGQNAVLALGQ